MISSPFILPTISMFRHQATNAFGITEPRRLPKTPIPHTSVCCHFGDDFGSSLLSSQAAHLLEIKAHHACSQSWPSVSQKWPGQEQEILKKKSQASCNVPEKQLPANQLNMIHPRSLQVSNPNKW